MVKKFEIREDIEIPENQIIEAQDKNVRLVSKTNNRCYGYYQLQCGHFTFLHYGAVRKSKHGSFHCKECLDIKLQKEADKFGLVYNKDVKSKGNDWRNYTFPCGHSRDMKTANVRFSAVACNECLQSKYEAEAESQGAVLLDKPRNDSKRHYLLPCGHEKVVYLTAMRQGVYRCRICQDNHYEKEAQAAGLIYHKDRKSSHYDYRIYTLPCGCTKEIAISCVPKGTFECKTHSKRTIDFTQPISVYLLKFMLPIGEVLKLGFAMDVNSRAMRYGLEGSIEYIYSRNFNNGQDAVNLERELHDKYSYKRLDKNLMSNYMENGFTECYPLDMIELLKSEIEQYNKETQFV